eukprot:GHVN01064900.1.p1 GENE.GHVN01064900.1~~GHVN01064900.1.p1  ORF type:complete len:125 (-),score=6.38 GHVN01064900.1:275-649(-)
MRRTAITGFAKQNTTNRTKAIKVKNTVSDIHTIMRQDARNMWDIVSHPVSQNTCEIVSTFDCLKERMKNAGVGDLLGLQAKETFGVVKIHCTQGSSVETVTKPSAKIPRMQVNCCLWDEFMETG